MTVRPMHRAVRPSPVFLLLVGLTALGGVLAWTGTEDDGPMTRIGVFLFAIAGWLVSLCLHEFGHAYTAWRYGDTDAAVRGYLTLNPLKYSNPVLSLGLPLLFIALGGIGLPGGAVYLRTGFMTPKQRTIVNLAGPLANLVLGILLLAATRLFFDHAHIAFWGGVAFLGFLQITALLLNLLPIPGLDGYAALEPHLSPGIRRAMEPVRQWGFFILLMVLLLPGPNRIFFSAVFWFVDLSGVPGVLVQIGGQLTRFWAAWL